MGPNPDTGRYIVARMTTSNGGPLSLGPIPSGRLKNLKDVEKWSSLSLCLSVRGMSVIKRPARDACLHMLGILAEGSAGSTSLKFKLKYLPEI